ncbi:hypothetical protein DV515_00004672 [Chloebia gouldiae]|uniref:Uncharacterized protein n=1 Tax=Chloebia gouldiae TaxID=44316 RepID=A0A3L8SQ11_CHLGU|nr:hypothetical protein DV515_00004672 [Chloebia gouldiae]
MWARRSAATSPWASDSAEFPPCRTHSELLGGQAATPLRFLPERLGSSNSHGTPAAQPQPGAAMEALRLTSPSLSSLITTSMSCRVSGAASGVSITAV